MRAVTYLSSAMLMATAVYSIPIPKGSTSTDAETSKTTQVISYYRKDGTLMAEVTYKVGTTSSTTTLTDVGDDVEDSNTSTSAQQKSTTTDTSKGRKGGSKVTTTTSDVSVTLTSVTGEQVDISSIPVGEGSTTTSTASILQDDTGAKIVLYEDDGFTVKGEKDLTATQVAKITKGREGTTTNSGANSSSNAGDITVCVKKTLCSSSHSSGRGTKNDGTSGEASGSSTAKGSKGGWGKSTGSTSASVSGGSKSTNSQGTGSGAEIKGTAKAGDGTAQAAGTQQAGSGGGKGPDNNGDSLVTGVTVEKTSGGESASTAGFVNSQTGDQGFPSISISHEADSVEISNDDSNNNIAGSSKVEIAQSPDSKNQAGGSVVTAGSVGKGSSGGNQKGSTKDTTSSASAGVKTNKGDDLASAISSGIGAKGDNAENSVNEVSANAGNRIDNHVSGDHVESTATSQGNINGADDPINNVPGAASAGSAQTITKGSSSASGKGTGKASNRNTAGKSTSGSGEASSSGHGTGSVSANSGSGSGAVGSGVAVADGIGQPGDDTISASLAFTNAGGPLGLPNTGSADPITSKAQGGTAGAVGFSTNNSKGSSKGTGTGGSTGAIASGKSNGGGNGMSSFVAGTHSTKDGASSSTGGGLAGAGDINSALPSEDPSNPNNDPGPPFAVGLSVGGEDGTKGTTSGSVTSSSSTGKGSSNADGWAASDRFNRPSSQNSAAKSSAKSSGGGNNPDTDFAGTASAAGGTTGSGRLPAEGSLPVSTNKGIAVTPGGRAKANVGSSSTQTNTDFADAQSNSISGGNGKTQGAASGRGGHATKNHASH